MKTDTRSQYEKYVADIDVAKRLRTCGFPQNCMFYWALNPLLDTVSLSKAEMEYQGAMENRFAAPTATEIKANFPEEVWITTKHRSIIRRLAIFYYSQYQGKHIVSLMIKSTETSQIYEVHREEDVNEANSIGNMYCYIMENHLNELHN